MNNDGVLRDGDRPPDDNRPELVRNPRAALADAGLDGVVGSVGMDRVDDEDCLDVGISVRTPKELEPQIWDAIRELPIRSIFWREPRSREDRSPSA